MNDLNGLILVGGESKRMQKDKALLIYHDKPQYIICAELLNEVCAQSSLSLKNEGHPDIDHGEGIIFDKEGFDNLGPVGGILSAMHEYPEMAWLVLACDLPFVNKKLLNLLIDHRNTAKMGTAFKSNYTGHPEPLCAIYEPHYKDSLMKFVDDGIFCPRKMMLNSDIELIDLPEPHALDNINTPQEFHEAVKQIKG